MWKRQHKSFRHGVHPPEQKLTCNEPIKQFPFAPLLSVPLSQHIGQAAIPVVREGQEVQRGQRIADPDGHFSVAMHAPATGIVKRIALTPGIAGKMVQGIYIQPHPSSTQTIHSDTPCILEESSPEDIIQAVQMAGIVGLGGAAFPTHIKLEGALKQGHHTLVINGVECEPYLTTDHRVMLEQKDDIMMGVRYLLKGSGADRAIIGIEANKMDAVEALRAAIPHDLPLTVEALEVKYPQGAEKMLVKAVTGTEIPSRGLPADIGVLVVNVATTSQIGHLLPRGQGIQDRIITISGPGIKKPGNYRIPIGTPLRFALEQVGVTDDIAEVYLGGPMMGQALPNLEISITKGVSGFVAFTEAQCQSANNANKEYPCINCGYCVQACPLFLNPARMGQLAINDRFEEMAADWHLMDCFECGSCAFVCPAHIPLVQRFRAAKSYLRKPKVHAS